MNKLIDIRNKYNLSNKDLATLFDVHPNTIGNMLNKDIIDLPLSYIVLLHRNNDIPYNTLLGATIFTPDNIDSNTGPLIGHILDNDNKYNRLLDKLKKDLNK